MAKHILFVRLSRIVDECSVLASAVIHHVTPLLISLKYLDLGT